MKTDPTSIDFVTSSSSSSSVVTRSITSLLMIGVALIHTPLPQVVLSSIYTSELHWEDVGETVTIGIGERIGAVGTGGHGLGERGESLVAVKSTKRTLPPRVTSEMVAEDLTR